MISVFCRIYFIYPENNTDKSEKIIHKIEINQNAVFNYQYNNNKASFIYILNASYTLPFNLQKNLFKQNKLTAALGNQASLSFDKLFLNLTVTPVIFADINASFTMIFAWKMNQEGGFLMKGSSLNDKNTFPVSGSGFNIDLGINLKFGFNKFFPLFKLALSDKITFSYMHFFGIEYWRTNQHMTMLKNGWIFINDLTVMWNDNSFAPYFILNTVYFFENKNAFALSLGAGFQIKLEKTGLLINANIIMGILPEDHLQKIKLTLMIKYTFKVKSFDRFYFK